MMEAFGNKTWKGLIEEMNEWEKNNPDKFCFATQFQITSPVFEGACTSFYAVVHYRNK
jgi:hypothetical protein